MISESLDYIINSNSGTLFKVSYHDKIVSVLNKSIFKKGVFKDLTDSVDKFWGKHTFLSICRDYFLSINDEYLLEHVSKNFLDVLLEIHKISICTDKMRGPYDNNSLILNNLDKGEINRRFKDKLLHTEKIIYQYFSSMYADIKDVRYNLDEDGEKIKYELMIYKNIGGKLTSVPISLESNGTKNLLELLTVFFWAVNGKICIVDEIDTGIHDILMNNVLRNLSDCVNG